MFDTKIKLIKSVEYFLLLFKNFDQMGVLSAKIKHLNVVNGIREVGQLCVSFGVTDIGQRIVRASETAKDYLNFLLSDHQPWLQ